MPSPNIIRGGVSPAVFALQGYDTQRHAEYHQRIVCVNYTVAVNIGGCLVNIVYCTQSEAKYYQSVIGVYQAVAVRIAGGRLVWICDHLEQHQYFITLTRSLPFLVSRSMPRNLKRPEPRTETMSFSFNEAAGFRTRRLLI